MKSSVYHQDFYNTTSVKVHTNKNEETYTPSFDYIPVSNNRYKHHTSSTLPTLVNTRPPTIHNSSFLLRLFFPRKTFLVIRVTPFHLLRASPTQHIHFHVGKERGLKKQDNIAKNRISVTLTRHLPRTPQSTVDFLLLYSSVERKQKQTSRYE